MTAPLSIAVVCFPGVGGSGVVATELATGLAARGHRVHLVAGARPSRAGAESGVEFHEVRAPSHPVFEHPPMTLALASALLDIARGGRLDVIHAHYALPHAPGAYLAKQLLGKDAPRLITALHGSDVTTVGPDPAYRALTAATILASDAVTVPSEFLREQAYRRLGLPRSLAIDLAPNSVDTGHFSPAHAKDRKRLHALFGDADADGPVLFHVSNFRPVKRVRDLLEVLSRVRRRVPARLVLVGDGPDRAAAEEHAHTLRVWDSVRFMNNRTDFVELLQHADAFLLTSESESFGVAPLEAMSAGVPVFGYRVGGVPEVVAPEAGTLVTPLDVDALARSVLDALQDPATLPAMGRAAREHVLAHFQRGPALSRCEALMRRIL